MPADYLREKEISLTEMSFLLFGVSELGCGGASPWPCLRSQLSPGLSSGFGSGELRGCTAC